MEKENNLFDGLDMFHSFMTDCRDELNHNYNSFLNHCKKNNNTEPPTFMEFCCLEFIKHSFVLFKKFLDEKGQPDDWTSIALSPQLEDELPN